MVTAREHFRVLIAANDPVGPLLHQLFATDPLQSWQTVKGESFAHAQFLLQHDACDLLLLDCRFVGTEEAKELEHLASRHEVPMVLLTAPGTVAGAWNGNQSLPRDLALARPDLLHEGLQQAVHAGDWQRDRRRHEDALQTCRQRVSHLTALLWEAVPTDGCPPWFTHHAMMDRLQEEVAIAERYQTPLSIAVGELPESPTETAPSGQALAGRSQMVEQIVRSKRRSDIAGQYGPHGFMLLMSCTAETGAAVCCRRIQRLLEQLSQGLPGPAKLRPHIGGATFSGVLTSPRSLLGRAEQCLEQACTAGNEPVMF